MKNTLYSCLLVVLLSSTASLFAQEAEETPTEGRPEYTYYHLERSHSFNLGVGFPNNAGLAFAALELAGDIVEPGSATPEFTLKYEYGLTRDVGIGLHLGYYSAKTPTVQSSINDLICSIDPTLCEFIESSKEIRATSIGARFAYHRRQFDRIDTYGNAVFGYSIIKERTIGEERSEFNRVKAPTFVYFTSIGARFYLTPKIALYGEFGFGNIAIVNVGATYRLFKE